MQAGGQFLADIIHNSDHRMLEAFQKLPLESLDIGDLTLTDAQISLVPTDGPLEDLDADLILSQADIIDIVYKGISFEGKGSIMNKNDLDSVEYFTFKGPIALIRGRANVIDSEE